MPPEAAALLVAVRSKPVIGAAIAHRAEHLAAITAAWEAAIQAEEPGYCTSLTDEMFPAVDTSVLGAEFIEEAE